MGLVKCVRSALRHDGMDGGTVAGRLAGEMGGTDCLVSGGSSPGREEDPVGTFHNKPNTLKECQTPAQQRRGCADGSSYLQGQFVAGVSAIHLRTGETEPPLKAG